jgi:uncharacterized membrane protein YkgB
VPPDAPLPFEQLLKAANLGGLLAVKPWWPTASVLGSVLAIMLFLATISFMFTTPGVMEASQGGFPALSAPGGFLMKHMALLGISVCKLADALRATRSTLEGASQPGAG